MNILLSYPSEFDQGEGVHFSRVLRRLGHAVRDINVAAGVNGNGVPGRLVKGYPSTAWLRDFIEEDWKPDLYLYIEPLGLIPRGLENSPIPTACVISDVHRDLSSRLTLAQLFDHVFLYQRNYVRHFTKHPRGSVHWLPYACDTEFFKDLGLERDLDVAFIGKFPASGAGSDRRGLIELLRRTYRVNEPRYYLQREIPEVYSRAKIVVNIPVGDDLNFRFFEALSCGALLLTRRLANGQEELFKEGVHYAAFESEAELLAKVEFYLHHEAERRQIATAGHEEVLRRHTLVLRLEQMLDQIRTGPRDTAPVRKATPAKVLGLYGSVYERGGRLEALLKLAAEQRPHPIGRLRMLVKGSKTFLRRAVNGW